MGHRGQRPQMAFLIGLMVVLPLLLGVPQKALGYTDPGTGTFAYQAIYAAVIGGSFYVRKLLRRLFGKRSDK